MFRLALAAAISILPALIEPALGESGPANISQIDSAILDGRRSIASAHVRITVTRFEIKHEQFKPESFEIYLDGPCIRQDRSTGSGTVSECFGRDHFYSWQEGGGGRHALKVAELAYEPRENHDIHDFRKIMVVPTWMEALNGRPLDDTVGSADRENLRTEDVSWEGQRAKEISFSRIGRNIRCSYVVVPEWGYSVVRMEVALSMQKIEFVDTFTATIQQVRTGIWFPRTVTFRRRQKGLEVMGQDLTIDVISLNEPLDPHYFDPTTMKVPADTLVLSAPKSPSGAQKWDGRRIVSMNGADRAKILFGYHPSVAYNHRRIVLIVLSALLLTLAWIMAAVRTRRADPK